MQNVNFMTQPDPQQDASLAQQQALASQLLQVDQSPAAPAQYSSGGSNSVNPMMLASLLHGDNNVIPQSVLDASMANGQGPTMANDATLQGFTNPNATPGNAFNSVMTAQNNTLNAPPLYSFYPNMGGQQ